MSVEILLMSCTSVWLSRYMHAFVLAAFQGIAWHSLALRCIIMEAHDKRLYDHIGMHAVGVGLLFSLLKTRGSNDGRG